MRDRLLFVLLLVGLLFALVYQETYAQRGRKEKTYKGDQKTRVPVKRKGKTSKRSKSDNFRGGDQSRRVFPEDQKEHKQKRRSASKITTQKNIRGLRKEREKKKKRRKEPVFKGDHDVQVPQSSKMRRRRSDKLSRRPIRKRRKDPSTNFRGGDLERIEFAEDQRDRNKRARKESKIALSNSLKEISKENKRRRRKEPVFRGDHDVQVPPPNKRRRRRSGKLALRPIRRRRKDLSTDFRGGDLERIEFRENQRDRNKRGRKESKVAFSNSLKEISRENKRRSKQSKEPIFEGDRDVQIPQPRPKDKYKDKSTTSFRGAKDVQVSVHKERHAYNEPDSDELKTEKESRIWVKKHARLLLLYMVIYI